MPNAKKLIETAYGPSSAPAFFSAERWFGRKAQNPQDQRPRVLAIGTMHDDDSAERFVTENAKALLSHNVVADFIEKPYWFNAILKGYKKGVVTDKELESHYKAFIDANIAAGNSGFVPMQLAEFEKIKALKSTPIETIAVDSRWQKEWRQDPNLGSSFRRAEELARQFPKSLKYAGFIEEAYRRGVPADAISASLVSLHLSEKKGHGVLTYGNGHFVGSCRPTANTQGILDDAIEKQGIGVTHVSIALNGEWFRVMEEGTELELKEKERHLRAGDKAWKACKDTADQMHFIYLYEQDVLISKEQFSKEEARNFFPATIYPKAEQVYRADQLDPTLIEELRQILVESGVTEGKNAISLPLSQPLTQNRMNGIVPRK